MITIIPNVKIKFPRFHALPSSSSALLSISNCFDVWINFNFIMLLRHLSCLFRLKSSVVLSENHFREMCVQEHYTRLKSSVIKMIFHRLPSLIRHTSKGFTNRFFSIITIALATKDLNAKLITHFFRSVRNKKKTWSSLVRSGGGGTEHLIEFSIMGLPKKPKHKTNPMFSFSLFTMHSSLDKQQRQHQQHP